MKLKFLFIILFFIGKMSEAQETLKPIVGFYGDNLVLDNFPAISDDGSHYLVKYSQYSCCISTEEKLQKIRIKDGKILDEVILYPGSETTQFTVEEQKNVYEKLLKILSNGGYTTLNRIPAFNQIYDEDKNTFIGFKIKKETYKSQKIDIPRLSSHGFCCNGGIDMKENCLLYQAIINVSFSDKHNILLIETGLDQLADGCDQGPFYQVIPILKN